MNVGAAAAVGDLYAVLTITFNNPGLGNNQSATWIADTDTVGLFIVPEPGTFAMLGIACLGLLAYARRRA